MCCYWVLGTWKSHWNDRQNRMMLPQRWIDTARQSIWKTIQDAWIRWTSCTWTWFVTITAQLLNYYGITQFKLVEDTKHLPITAPINRRYSLGSNQSKLLLLLSFHFFFLLMNDFIVGNVGFCRWMKLSKKREHGCHQWEKTNSFDRWC